MIIHLHSKWVTAGGRIFEVNGIWATGGYANYKALAYDLLDAAGVIKTVERDLLVELIGSGKLKRCN